MVRQSKVAHGEMGDEATHVVVRAQMLMVLPKKLRMDASKQKELTGLNKVEFLDLFTRVYECRNEKACWKCAVKGHVYAECSKNPKNM